MCHLFLKNITPPTIRYYKMWQIFYPDGLSQVTESNNNSRLYTNHDNTLPWLVTEFKRS